MAKSSESWIVLLRAIGPATHKKMSMQQLRDASISAGLTDVRTYIASGNLLFRSSLSQSELQTMIEEILSDHGLDNDVIVRKPSELKSVLHASPFPRAASTRPNHLLTVFYSHKVNKELVKVLISRNLPERISILEREICIDYINGVANSKLVPALIDHTIGQPGTARNWNTLNKPVDLMEG